MPTSISVFLEFVLTSQSPFPVRNHLKTFPHKVVSDMLKKCLQKGYCAASEIECQSYSY